MISNCFQIQNIFTKPFLKHIRKRNLIKRFNGIEDYDPLLPLFRLIIGLLRLYPFYDDFRVENSLVHKYPRRASGYGT